MKKLFGFLFSYFFSLTLLNLAQHTLGQTPLQNRNVFQVLDAPKTFFTSEDIIHFQPSSYTASPWNFAMADLLDSGDFQKSATFFIRHNMTTPPTSDVIIIRAASTISKAPVNPTDAHFVVSFTASGANTLLKLTYLVKGTATVTQTLTSPVILNPHTWYGVFISRFSSNQDRGAIFVYDTSNVNGAGTNYVNNLQQVLTPNPAGYSKTGATANFYIDIGGDSQISTPCNCEITNFNFLYKRYFSNDVNVALELIKSPPNLLLSLEFKEIDNSIQLTKDYSSINNVVFRGDSQFDTNRDTQLNYDQTPNGDVGHIYSQNGFDTISPAFDLGREYAVSFWIQFSARPSSVTNDALQPVLFKQNSQYPDMKVYLAFQATATQITGLYLQSGGASKTETLPVAITRGDGGWYYFYVYFGNFYKNESANAGTFHPTTLYTIQYTLASGALATPISGIMDDYYIHGGSTDIMRIGMGVDGQNENLFAVIKKLQIFSGGWFFEVTGSAGSYSVGGDQFIHIAKGQLTSRILCQKCSATTILYADDCLTTCSQGSYQVTTDTNFDHCETCYENCKTCTGRLGTQCSNCFFGNWMPFDSLNCPGKNPCNIHQYDVGNVCQECMDECASCKDSSSCSACAAGFSYNQATHQCEIQTCGDGIVVAGEQCDDGNQFNGDGCSTDCKIELGWYCDPAGGSCYTICGDNVQASNEKCDDGNNLSGDGCDYKCQVEDGYFCEYTNPANIAPFTDVSYKQTCTQCTTDCKVCESATTCSVCTTGNFLSGGTCVASCSIGFYQDTTTNSCQQCPDLCSECTSSSVCTNCIAGAALLNDECLDTCPDGTYNDIDTSDGLRKCLTCPANCVTCASSTQCYTCDTHFFLDIGGSNLCVECDNSCRTCFGPAATNCVLCPPGLTFQVSSSSCINLVCLSSEYANFAIGECQPCDTTCETCSGTLETNCLTCPVQTALSVSHRCLDCIPPNGLVLNADDSCTDICGDGRRVKLVTQCDDGNLIDGDGCSSKCEVEAGWMCSGGNETRADTCVSYIGPKPLIKVSTKDPTVFEISFDRKVVNTLQDKEFVTQILVSLEGIDVDNSRYAISWDSNLQIFRVKFDLLESVVDSMLTVQFKDPLRITDSFLNPVSPSILNRGYPIYYYIDPETRDTAEGLATFSIVLQSINTATMIPLAISGYLSHYWMFLEFFQMVHNLQLIDVRTPYLANEFFISFRYLKLYWLPNAPEDSDMNYDASGQQGKGKFSDLEIDTFFLRNNGYQLTSWAFLLVLWVFLKVIIKVGLKRSLLKKLVYIVMINLEWSLILRAVIEMYFDFCIYSYLQLSNLSFEKGIEGFSSILAIVATVFTVLFPIFCIRKTLQVKNQYLLEEDIKYDTLYREFRKRHRSTALFLAVVLFHKVLMAAILVGLQTSPEVQIALLVALQVSMIMILLVVRPYVDGSMNFRAIIQELILFAVIALFYGLLNENTDEHVRNNVGKVIVALLIIALLMHCAFLLKDAYLAIQEYRQNPEGAKKNIFGAARVTPSSNQFQLNSGSDIMSDGLELPARSDNGSAQGYRPVSSEIIKEEDETKDIPKKISIDEESLFKDNEKIKIPPLSMQKVYINSKEIKDESKIIPSDVGSHELKEDDRLMGVSGR